MYIFLGTAVLEKVGFLNNCLVARGKFLHSCREQAWAKYYHAYTQHMGDVTELTGAPATSTWLCMGVFGDLLDKAYPLAHDTGDRARQCFQLPEDTKDIVSYIGGSIVTKLRRKAATLQDSDDKEAILDCLSELCDPDGNGKQSGKSDCRLTKTLNRGGLVFLKTSAQHFFQLLEVEVKRACNTVHGKAHLKLTEFVEECAADETLTSAFHSATYIACNEEQKEFIFAKIVQLYYKIRVHHECKLFMERLKCKASTVVQKKGLRKTLKAQNSVSE